MTKIIYDTQTMQVMTLFETITQAELKDCIFLDESVLFVVQEAQIGKAIGKQGRNAHQLEKALKRKVKIVEFSPDVVTFIKNLFYPLQTNNVTSEDGTVTVVPVDSRTRGQMIGRNAAYLRWIEDIVKRYFQIKEIKIDKW